MDLGSVALCPAHRFAINGLALPGSSGWGWRGRQGLGELSEAGFQSGDIERAEGTSECGGTGQAADREAGEQLKAMVVNPLADGAAGPLAAEESGTDQGEEQGPGMTLAASLARVRDIDNGVHQGAILGCTHHPPSFLCCNGKRL